jgi:LPXTG-motif cell wall-anchored protein
MSGDRVSQRLGHFVAAGFIVAAVLAPAAAWADYPSPPVSAVSPNSEANPAAVHAAAPSSGSSALPMTGGDIAGLAVIGGGLVVGGAVLRRARQRRPSSV